MVDMKNILQGQSVDIYDSDVSIATALAGDGADQVTLYTRERRVVDATGAVVTKPYGAILEAADCVADVCVLDNDAIKVLVAMYPSAPRYVLVRLAPRLGWRVGFFGLLRRLILRLVHIDKIIAITDTNGKKSRWLLLQQRGMATNKSPTLPGVIGVTKFLEWMRAEKINYVVLRFYEKLPNLYRDAGDIDILLSNADKDKVKDYLHQNKHLLTSVSKDIRLGLHSVSGEKGSIPYYPPHLARQILNDSIVGPAGALIPSHKDALNSFIYHALYHAKKGYAAGIPSAFKKHTEQNPENDYSTVIKEMARSANISLGETMEDLDNYLAREGWRPKLDTLSKLSETNAWVYDRFFAVANSGPVGLAVFMLREWVLEEGIAEQVINTIKANEFKILRQKVLSSEEKRRASEILRGGSWGENIDGSTKGWLPAIAIVVVDLKCVKMPPAYARGYEHFKIRNLKNVIRSKFDKEERGSVHSTDNTHESWEYIDICFHGESDAIKSEFENLAHVSMFFRVTQLFSPTYLKHSLRYSLRETLIRRFLS